MENKSNREELKLYCYSIEGFKKAMENLGYGRDDEKLLEKDNIAVISICCTDTVNLPEHVYWEEEHYFNNKTNSPNILNIEFDDIDPNTWHDKDINPFDIDNAKPEDFVYRRNGMVNYALDFEKGTQIIEFINNNKGKDFYIHCSAGVSRSQGIVRYILDIYGDEYNYKIREDNPPDLPNYHVLQVLKRCWYKKMVDLSIKIYEKL